MVAKDKFKQFILLQTKESLIVVVFFLFTSTTALGFNTQQLPFLKKIKSSKNQTYQLKLKTQKEFKAFSLANKTPSQNKTIIKQIKNTKQLFDKKTTSIANTQKTTDKKTIKNDFVSNSQNVSKSKQSTNNQSTQKTTTQTPILKTNSPTTTPKTIPITSPSTTPTIIPTTFPTLTPIPTIPTPTATNSPSSQNVELTLFPEGSATPNGNGKVNLNVIKNDNGYWDFIVSGAFKSLQPQRNYQFWLCNTNCSSHSDAKFTTDSSGHGSISNVTINYAQVNDPLSRAVVWENPPQGEIKSDSTTCYMISNNSSSCLKASISF